MFLWWKVVFSCFTQSPSNFTLLLAPLKKAIPGVRLLSNVVGGLMLFPENPLDFHAMIWLLLKCCVLKYLKASGNTE